MILPRLLLACSLFAVAATLPAQDKPKPDAPKPAEDGFRSLFDGKTLDGWVNVNCHPGTFFVKDGEIVTTGKPTGFLRSDRQYENFVLEFDWMHVEKTKMANSGLFVWGDPLPAVGAGYTRGIEVQVLINFAPKDGWATSHGDIFSIWGAKCTPDRVHPVNPKMERCLPSENRVKGGGEWNHYKVTANDGAIKLEVNGKEVSGVSKCNPRKGYLALESEDAECHFKNIKIKELPTTNPKPEEVAKVAEGHVSIFNGLDLKGWKTEEGAWKAGGGVLRAAGKADLTSEKKYDPCELIFDWKLGAQQPAGCGVRLAGVTQLVGPQVHSVSTVGEVWELGKRAGNRPPDVKSGVWYRSVVRFDGKKFTYTLNGSLVDALEAKKAVDPEPITFSPTGLEIMNVFVRELKEEKK